MNRKKEKKKKRSSSSDAAKIRTTNNLKLNILSSAIHLKLYTVASEWARTHTRTHIHSSAAHMERCAIKIIPMRNFPRVAPIPLYHSIRVSNEMFSQQKYLSQINQMWMHDLCADAVYNGNVLRILKFDTVSVDWVALHSTGIKSLISTRPVYSRNFSFTFFFLLFPFAWFAWFASFISSMPSRISIQPALIIHTHTHALAHLRTR